MKKSAKDLGISERISKLRSHFNLSYDAFGQKAGVSGQAIANIEQGKSLNPGAEMLANLASILGVNLNWLLSGEGEMFKNSGSDAQARNISSYKEFSMQAQEPDPGYNTRLVVGKIFQLNTSNESKPDLLYTDPPFKQSLSPDDTTNARRIPIDSLSVRVLPYLSFGARANFAEHFDDDLNKYPWEHGESLAVLNVPDTKEFAEALLVDVEGDSMEPTIINGSKVVVTPVQQGNWQYMSSGIYCIIYNGNFVVKRVKDNTLMEKGILHLHSDNPNAGSFPVRGEDIRAVWRVRWAAYVPIQ